MFTFLMIAVIGIVVFGLVDKVTDKMLVIMSVIFVLSGAMLFLQISAPFQNYTANLLAEEGVVVDVTYHSYVAEELIYSDMPSKYAQTLGLLMH